jgi:hypothetical protein
MDLQSIGKLIIVIGIIAIFTGLLMILGKKIGLGKLPGDIYIEKGNLKFYFPITTSIIISIIITIILNLIFRHK